MIVSKENIETCIPQRSPFIMVDNLVTASTHMFETNFLILPGNIFLDKDKLREFALVENIAQSSSAGLAVTKMIAGKKGAEGYMGAISKLKLYNLPGVNDTIYTVIYLKAQLENMFLVRGENYANGKKLLECELKLVGI